LFVGVMGRFENL